MPDITRIIEQLLDVVLQLDPLRLALLILGIALVLALAIVATVVTRVLPHRPDTQTNNNPAPLEYTEAKHATRGSGEPHLPGGGER